MPDLLSIDHISSFPGVLFPIREITAVCRENDALVLIDGAHAVGHIPVDLAELAVDFYAGESV